MNTPNATSNGGMTPRAILAAIYRHRFMVILLGIAGLAGAAYVYRNIPPAYESTAKLLIRYIVERRSLDGDADNAETLEPANQQVVDTEQQILTSYDLAREVAETVGPEKLLGDAAPPPGFPREDLVEWAAGTVAGGIRIQPSGNVLQVTYRHTDKDIPATALKAVMEEYFKKHIEVRREVKSVDFLIEEEARLRQRLAETESELNRLRAESGIMSLESLTESHQTAKQDLQEKIQQIRVDLQVQKQRVARSEKTDAERRESGEAVRSEDADAEERKQLMIAANRFELLNGRLQYLESSRNDLLGKYQDNHPRVRNVETRIAETQTGISTLVEEHPALLAGGEEIQLLGLAGARDVLDELENREAVLTDQLAALNDRFEKDYKVGARLSELERQRRTDEAKHALFQTSLERVRGDEALDPSLIPNISVLQNPSPAVRIFDEDMLPLLVGLAGGGFALGIGFALVRDLMFNSRVRGPVEIEARLQLPLLLSIPHFKRLARHHRRYLPADTSPDQTSRRLALNGAPNHNGTSPRNTPSTPVAAYAEAIRDRLLLNFHLNNINHKPKLVALAGLANGVGTSTITWELAAALAKTPGTRTLLVDMNAKLGALKNGGGDGTAGTITLDTAINLARESKIRPGELHIASVASRSEGGGLENFAPKHLFDLLPEIHASAFDYILFDMPPINPTSPTPAMAGMMDKTLLILDAERTERENLRWGYSELVRGGADVSCIVNKNRAQPRWLAEAC